VRALQRLAAWHRQRGHETLKGLKRLKSGVAAKADGARYLARASKELRILLDYNAQGIRIVHLVRRNNKHFFDGER
jgi:hypothetical protein